MEHGQAEVRSLTERERTAFAAVKQLRLALPAERAAHASALAAATQAADAAAAAAKAGRGESAEALRLRAATSSAANECAPCALLLGHHSKPLVAALHRLALSHCGTNYLSWRFKRSYGRCAVICVWHPARARVRVTAIAMPAPGRVACQASADE